MNSVWAPLTVIALYVYFIFNLGPRLMKNRPPMQLDTVIKIYDIIQVILNFYIAERVSNSDTYCQINFPPGKKIFLLQNSNFRHCAQKIPPNVHIMNQLTLLTPYVCILWISASVSICPTHIQ